MDRPKLLITGIHGAIGSILDRNLGDSYEIYGLARRGPFSDRVFEADVSVYQQVKDAFRKCGPVDYIVHLAADPRVAAPWESILPSNIIGTHNVYEAAREFHVRRVVFASSNHVTGAYEGFGQDLHLHTQYEPDRILTTDPVRPDSDYGVSKAFGEAVARYYCARWGIESVCLRIGSVLRDDDPSGSDRFRKTWLSHRDLVHLVRRSLAANVVFGIYYGVSNNRGAFWDISNARFDLGYEPQDDASAR